MVNWKFWKRYTITHTEKIGSLEYTYTVTAPSEEEAKRIAAEMEGRQ